MAKRKKGRFSFSLFPFLSVLITIIGILIFMTLAISISSTAIDLPLIVEDAIVRVPGSGDTDTRTPVLVECKDNATFVIKNVRGKAVRDQEFNVADAWNHVIEVYRNDKQNNPDSWNGDPFLEFLNELKGKGARFLLFVVRPSGIYPYTMLSDIVKMRNDIKPENEIVETDSADETDESWERDWKVDWALIYQKENRKVIPPTS